MRAIGPPLTEQESQALIDCCRALVNRVRFRHQGRNPSIGLDCAGMLIWALRQIGREPVDMKGYGREPHKNGLRQTMEVNLGPGLDRSQMRSGDVPLMRFHGEPRHVGLLTNLSDGRMGLIHVHADNKIVAEHGLAGYWGDIVAVFRP